MAAIRGKLYLIPVTLGEASSEEVLSPCIYNTINNLKHFIVENERTARRFIKKINKEIYIDELNFYLLNKHSHKNELDLYIDLLLKGECMGIMSEAGTPAVADPGSDLVLLAHKYNIQVIPLAGPCSITLALMASGLNGQNFCFHGYLPIKKKDRIAMIKNIEKKSSLDNQTQIFIETPYRNQHLYDDILKNCKDSTLLCIASNLTLESEMVLTRSINEWRVQKINIHKIPVVFLIHAI